MKETEEKQDVKKQVSDKIKPWHRVIQVQMQLSEPQKTTSACLSCLAYKIVMLIIASTPTVVVKIKEICFKPASPLPAMYDSCSTC